MSVPLGFTVKQLRIWGMRREGIRQAEIGRRLGVSRQAVHQSLRGIDGKIAQSLNTTASAAKIEVSYVDTVKGVLLGYSHVTRDRAIVTFSTRHGPHIWHYYTGQCEGCNLHHTCREVILDEAEERGITLTSEEKQNSPAEIARRVFATMIPELKP